MNLTDEAHTKRFSVAPAGETVLANDREIGSTILYEPPCVEFLRESLMKEFQSDYKVIKGTPE